MSNTLTNTYNKSLNYIKEFMYPMNIFALNVPLSLPAYLNIK